MIPVAIIFGLIFLVALLVDTLDEPLSRVGTLTWWSATLSLIAAIGVCLYALSEYL